MKFSRFVTSMFDFPEWSVVKSCSVTARQDTPYLKGVPVLLGTNFV